MKSAQSRSASTVLEQRAPWVPWSYGPQLRFRTKCRVHTPREPRADYRGSRSRDAASRHCATSSSAQPTRAQPEFAARGLRQLAFQTPSPPPVDDPQNAYPQMRIGPCASCPSATRYSATRLSSWTVGPRSQHSLEQELRELNAQIREARKMSKLAARLQTNCNRKEEQRAQSS